MLVFNKIGLLKSLLGGENFFIYISLTFPFSFTIFISKINMVSVL